MFDSIPNVLRQLLAATTVWAWVGSLVAAEDPRCPITISGLADPEWLRAAAAVSERQWSTHDCSSVELAVDADGARLSFTTHDGRVAHRRLTKPEQLHTSLLALVTVPLEVPESTTRTAAVDEPNDVVDASASKSVPVAKPASAARASSPLDDASSKSEPGRRLQSGSAPRKPQPATALFSLATGARMGQAGLVSPLVGTSAFVEFQRWQLGALSALELQYFDLAQHDDERRKSSAIAFGAGVGRREPAGDVALSITGHVMLAALFHDSTGDDGAEVRTGATLGISYPRRATARFRGELGGDVVVAGHRPGPISPGWAASGSIGVEFGGP